MLSTNVFALILAATSALVTSPPVAAAETDRTVVSASDAWGQNETWYSDDDCHNVDISQSPGVTYITSTQESYEVRVWPSSNCWGPQAAAYQATDDKRSGWSLEGHRMYENVLSVSTCSSGLRATCIAKIAAGLVAAPLTFGLSAVVQQIQLYNGPCRFCFGDTPFQSSDSYFGKEKMIPNYNRPCHFCGDAQTSTDLSDITLLPEDAKKPEENFAYVVGRLEVYIMLFGDMTEADLKDFYRSLFRNISVAVEFTLAEWVSSTLARLDLNKNGKIDLSEVEKAKKEASPM